MSRFYFDLQYLSISLYIFIIVLNVMNQNKEKTIYDIAKIYSSELAGAGHKCFKKMVAGQLTVLYLFVKLE